MRLSIIALNIAFLLLLNACSSNSTALSRDDDDDVGAGFNLGSISDYPETLSAIGTSDSVSSLLRAMAAEGEIIDSFYVALNLAGGGSGIDGFSAGACWVADMLSAALSATSENERDFCELKTQDESFLDQFVTGDSSTFKYVKVMNSYMGQKRMKVRVLKDVNEIPIEYEAFACGLAGGDFTAANYSLKTLDTTDGAIRYVYQVFDGRLNTRSSRINFEMTGTINADGQFVGERSLRTRELSNNGGGVKSAADYRLVQDADTLDFDLRKKGQNTGNSQDYEMTAVGRSEFSVDANLIETALLGEGAAKIVFEGIRGGAGPLADPISIEAVSKWQTDILTRDAAGDVDADVAASVPPDRITDIDAYDMEFDESLEWDCALPDGEEWIEITLANADEGALGDCAEKTSALPIFFDLCNQ
jgi:hypothetical protein